jgi:hypothetical protein
MLVLGEEHFIDGDDCRTIGSWPLKSGFQFYDMVTQVSAS